MIKNIYQKRIGLKTLCVCVVCVCVHYLSTSRVTLVHFTINWSKVDIMLSMVLIKLSYFHIFEFKTSRLQVPFLYFIFYGTFNWNLKHLTNEGMGFIFLVHMPSSWTFDRVVTNTITVIISTSFWQLSLKLLCFPRGHCLFYWLSLTLSF